MQSMRIKGPGDNKNDTIRNVEKKDVGRVAEEIQKSYLSFSVPHFYAKILKTFGSARYEAFKKFPSAKLNGMQSMRTRIL